MKTHTQYKKGEILNSYFTKISFGLGAFGISFVVGNNVILIKTGVPMQGLKTREIIPLTDKNVLAIKSLSKEFLSERPHCRVWEYLDLDV